MEVGNEAFQICDERGNALGFRSEGEQLLFEIKIKGQRCGKREGELGRVSGSEILSSACQSEQFGVQLNRPGEVFLCRSVGFIVDEQNFGLQEGSILIYAQDLEPLATFGHQVESAIGVFFHYADDFGGASHLGNALLNRAYHAKIVMLGQTFANHLFVARLENVQR